MSGDERDEVEECLPPPGIHIPYDLIKSIPLDQYNIHTTAAGRSRTFCCEGKHVSFNDDHPIGTCPYHGIRCDTDGVQVEVHRQPQAATNDIYRFNLSRHGLIWFAPDFAHQLETVLFTSDSTLALIIFGRLEGFYALLVDVPSDDVIGHFKMARDTASTYSFRQVVISQQLDVLCVLLKRIPRTMSQSVFTINVYEIHVYKRQSKQSFDIPEHAYDTEDDGDPSEDDRRDGGPDQLMGEHWTKFIKLYHQDKIEGMMIEGPAFGFLPGQPQPTVCIANFRDNALLGESNVLLALFDLESRCYRRTVAYEDPQVAWLDLWYYNLHGVVANPAGTLIAVCYETRPTASHRSRQHSASILLFDSVQLQLLREVFSPVALIMPLPPLLPTKGCYVNFIPRFSACGSQMALLRTELQPDMSMKRFIDIFRMPWTCNLQKLCRSVIATMVRADRLGKLPLPVRLIDYLRYKH